MKIAIARRKFALCGSGGGAERYAASVVTELVRRGHQVTVFSEEFKGDATKELRWIKVHSQMELTLCPTAAFHKIFQKTINRKDFDVLYSICRTCPSDVLRITEQIHSIWLPIAYSPFARFNPRHKGILKLEQKIFNPVNTGWILTNSELVKNQVVAEHGFPQEKICTVRNGVDHKTFFPAHGAERQSFRDRLKIPHDKLAMLFVAENFKIKGLEYAIRAIASLDKELKSQSLLLVVGGDSPTSFQRLARKLGVEQNIHFLGTRRGMRELYTAADLLLYPSLYEPFANTCLEAFSCALPAITTSMNGASELVEHGRTGYVVAKATDIKSIAQCIKSFASLNPIERSAMGQAALDNTRDLTWESHVDKLEEMLTVAAVSRKH